MAARAAATDAPEETDAEAVRCLTPAQLADLLEHARVAGPFEFFVLLLVLARTGVRIGEAVGLQWGDLDLDARVALVRRTCKGERISTPKSGKGRRVYLTPQLCEALRELQRQRRVVALDDERRAREWVFPDQRTCSKPMQYRRFYERFVPLVKKLGLRGVTPHTLRHTYASLLFAQGKTMHFVQEQLGHHDPKFTASVYGHLIPGDRRGEVDFLDGLGMACTTAANGSEQTIHS
jgi:integrase